MRRSIGASHSCCDVGTPARRQDRRSHSYGAGLVAAVHYDGGTSAARVVAIASPMPALDPAAGAQLLWERGSMFTTVDRDGRMSRRT
jgi:hypothetical protein